MPKNPASLEKMCGKKAPKCDTKELEKPDSTKRSLEKSGFSNPWLKPCFKCAHCGKKYRKIGIWLFNHFQKKHPHEKIVCSSSFIIIHERLI